MPREAGRWVRLLVAGWDLLVLEVKVVTGGRALVLALVELAAFVALAIAARLREEPWSTATLYNVVVLTPGLVPAVALGMAAVMGERDTRQLEVTFATPSGRYLVWSFRMAAIGAACFLSAAVMSVGTAIVIDHDHRPVAGALHAVPPLLLVASLTVFASLAFNGAAVAGLVVSALLAVSWLVLHPAPPFLRRFDVFFNPFAPPESLLLDPATWFRAVVFNRTLLLVLAGLCIAGTLWLLQKRERLL
jgi:hypothetical protein